MLRQLLWLLEFPQNGIGRFLRLVFAQKPHRAFRDAAVYNLSGSFGAFTIGDSIFCDDACFHDDQILLHEYGHRLQSRILCVLYLPVIALPSLVWASCFEGYRKRTGVSYYAFYTEAWANRLSGANPS